MARVAKGVLCTNPREDMDLSGESKVSDRIIGHGKAFEYCLWGLFFFWLPKLSVERNFLLLAFGDGLTDVAAVVVVAPPS